MELLRYFRPQRGSIILIGVLSVVSAQVEALALVVLVPLAEAIAGDRQSFTGEVGPFRATVSIGQLMAVAVAAVVAALVLNVIIAWLRSTVMTRWQHSKRIELSDAFLDANWPTQAMDRAGFLPMINSYASHGGSMLGMLTDLLRHGCTVLIFVLTAMFIDMFTAMTITATGAVLFLALRPLTARVRRGSEWQASLVTGYGEELAELSTGALDIRVFDARQHFHDRLAALSARLQRVRQRQAFYRSSTQPLYQYGGMLMALVAIAATTRIETVNIAGLGAIALLLLRSLSYGQALQGDYQGLADAWPYVQSLEAHQARLLLSVEDDGEITLESVQGLEVRGVSYSYEGEHKALDDVDLTLRRGQIVGLVGASGSGKSTLSQILLRLRRPDEGIVLVNGTPADEFTRSSWTRLVTLVPQEPQLLHATVAENISYFAPDIDRAGVQAAARAAGIDAVIEALPAGYDTEVGRSTRNLSGGQIQRVGIARALARHADVLVLDEPTSALDVHTEAIIQKTLKNLKDEMIVVVIAHRLSTLSICDRLVVMREGRVEADGALETVFETSEYFRTALDSGVLELGAGAPSSPGSP